jgi:hypothetical protein
MAKLLKDFLAELYEPRSPDEKKFVDKHVVTKFKNMYSEPEYDPVFNGSKVEPIDREKERHGYSAGADEKVYEETEQLVEISKETKKDYGVKALLQIPALRKKRDEAKSGKEYIKTDKKVANRLKGAQKVFMKNEETESLEEVLKVSDGIGAWIDDFQKSKNPKFEGKSKEERRKQAIAAFYAAKRKG